VERPTTSISAVAALSEIGRPAPGDAREYVEPFGLADDDVPALVELAKRWIDDAHFDATSRAPSASATTLARVAAYSRTANRRGAAGCWCLSLEGGQGGAQAAASGSQEEPPEVTT
jgi:hypothetical protein